MGTKSVFLEETVDYRVHPIDILQGDQFDSGSKDFSKQQDARNYGYWAWGWRGSSLLFESGAICATSLKDRKILSSRNSKSLGGGAVAHLQVAHFGPMLGQSHHFNIYAPEQVLILRTIHSRNQPTLQRPE